MKYCKKCVYPETKSGLIRKETYFVKKEFNKLKIDRKNYPYYLLSFSSFFIVYFNKEFLEIFIK
jgi:hypothetical protein|tara:strand:+ start:298 stop:489 length:192 start_codon:yes stop_codon:yes gene_type:complete